MNDICETEAHELWGATRMHTVSVKKDRKHKSESVRCKWSVLKIREKRPSHTIEGIEVKQLLRTAQVK